MVGLAIIAAAVLGVQGAGLGPGGAAGGAPPKTVTFDSLLAEMVDRDALVRFPDPPYTCKQFSSYDRASKTPDDAAGWFANADVGQYLRVDERDGRREFVMADMDGPGAVVRVWSANPKGTLRVYLDGAAEPVIEGTMADVLGGKWKVGEPLAGVQSRGYNLYLPIPYAKHCLITSDADGFYYQVDYRTYPVGTAVQTLRAGDPASGRVAETGRILAEPRPASADRSETRTLGPGESAVLYEGQGPGELVTLALNFTGEPSAQMLRSLVIEGTFDGERTIWCPVSDFFGCGVGVSAFQDWYRSVSAPGELRCDWVMPHVRDASVKLTNLGRVACTVRALAKGAGLAAGEDASRLMHFHANWHMQYPIHALGGKGTMDWNYITATGKGVYVGDSLAVMNPVKAWWGEGDEKIYVDGEAFPSHFGTGTEDYYGYAWCDPHVFQHPFHAQPRCDGNGKSNWGHTTVTRVRSLDAIPFTKSLGFDMEVWHWAECDVAYAATTYWYALPGATSNVAPDPDGARREIPMPPPLPKPLAIEGAVECETMRVAGKSEGLAVVAQDMEGFARRTWSGGAQVWVQGRNPGDFVELVVPAGTGHGARTLVLHATRSWDYGIVKFSVNGKAAGPAEGAPIDLYSGGHSVKATGPIELGTFEPRDDGTFVLRAEVVGGNAKAEGTRAYFGLDCVVVK